VQLTGSNASIAAHKAENAMHKMNHGPSNLLRRFSMGSTQPLHHLLLLAPAGWFTVTPVSILLCCQWPLN
jgi:hypothetical protein